MGGRNRFLFFGTRSIQEQSTGKFYYNSVRNLPNKGTRVQFDEERIRIKQRPSTMQLYGNENGIR
jgi:hypothetical protein